MTIEDFWYYTNHPQGTALGVKKPRHKTKPNDVAFPGGHPPGGNKKRLFDLSPHCYYCTARLTWDGITRDHIIPNSKGGSGGRGNIVLACKRCNNKKGDKSLENFLRIDVDKHLNILKHREISLAEFHTLCAFVYGPYLDKTLPKLASSLSEGDPRGYVTIEQCEEAYANLKKRGWVTVADEKFLEEIAKIAPCKPVYGYPVIGEADFTVEGARAWLDLQESFESRKFSDRSICVWDNDLKGYYSNTLQDIQGRGSYEKCGPWCIRWWYTFPEGWKTLKKGEK